VALGSLRDENDLEAFVRRLIDRLGLRAGQSRPPRYLTADRPDPTLKEGLVIYVPDGAAGAKLQYSDGTAWQPAG
jgi:hypothetical protein